MPVPRLLAPAGALLCALVLLAFAPRPARAAPVAFVGAEIRTVSRGTLEDGVLIFENGRITAVGPRGEVEVPPGARVHELGGRIVVPGLVDTHSHIGIYPRPAVPAHADGNDVSAPGDHPRSRADAGDRGRLRLRRDRQGGGSRPLRRGPFEYTSHVTAVIAGGDVVFER